MSQPDPVLDNPLGTLQGQMDLLPKPTGGQIPMLITGSSQQSPEWVAQHGDGWMTYPRPAALQAQELSQYRTRQKDAGLAVKPVMQSLYLDLDPNPSAPVTPIHLGFRAGLDALQAHLLELKTTGVNHVALNLRFNRGNIATTLKEISREILPSL